MTGTIKYVLVTTLSVLAVYYAIAHGWHLATDIFDVSTVPTRQVATAHSTMPNIQAGSATVSSPLLGTRPRATSNLALHVEQKGDRQVDGLDSLVEVIEAVNMRSGPSGSTPVIKVQLAGTRLHYAARHGNWIEVVDRESSARGWVYAKYVKRFDTDRLVPKLAQSTLGHAVE